MLVVYEAVILAKILLVRYLAKLMTCRISFTICYITFKTRQEDGFVGEFMLFLDGISAWDDKTFPKIQNSGAKKVESTRERERERGLTPVMYVTRLLSHCQCLVSTRFGRI